MDRSIHAIPRQITCLLISIYLIEQEDYRSELRSLSAFATHFASLTRLLGTRFQIN